MKAILRRLLFTFTLVACSGVLAQQSESATFEMRSLTPEMALRAAQAALQSCAHSGYQITVAVYDRSASPLVLLRDRLAGLYTPEAAGNKAYSAIAFRLDTLALANATQANQTLSGIRHLSRVAAIGGGRIIEAGGELVGSIGISGTPDGEKDDACARAGIAAIQQDLDF